MNALKKTDTTVYELIKQEEKRQRDVLEMIPSENYTSKAVMEAMGSVLRLEGVASVYTFFPGYKESDGYKYTFLELERDT